MSDLYFDLFASSLQDGYVGNLIDIVLRAGGEEKLYYMSEEELINGLNLSKRMAGHIINRRNSFNYEETLRIMNEKEIKFYKYDNWEYPRRLLTIPSRPYGLFVIGNLPPDDEKTVAVIGARNCSEYGRLMAEYFGDRLARENVNIISGMAYGIDGIAQMAALDANGKSYGVLGCGVDVVYPLSNKRLYDRLKSGGGLISEYFPATCAASRNFPPRNRIISGLSDLILVVEAKAKSGTLITVDMAIEQNKEVMVVPGRITDPLSVGCLNLMKTGAFPILSIDDVLERLGMRIGHEKKDNSSTNGIAEKSGKLNSLSDDEKLVYGVLDFYSMGIEEIVLKTKLPISRALRAATGLEIKGVIKSLSPSTFAKIS